MGLVWIWYFELRNEKCASRWPAHPGRLKGLLLCWCRLVGRVRGAGEDGAVSACSGEQDRQTDRGQHEDDRRVGGQLGEEVGCATRTECGLRTLAAEGSGEVGRLALLQKDDANEKKTDDNVKEDEKNNHRSCLVPLEPGDMMSGECSDRCGAGNRSL